MAIDVQGKEFMVGRRLPGACKMFRVDGLYIEIHDVTKVDGDKVYLADSTRPMRHPERLCILNK